MSKLYSIQESTLTNIGNALRSKYGEIRPETIQVPYVIAKSSNVTDLNVVGPSKAGSEYVVVRIPGATKIEVNLYYSTQNWAKVYIASGEYQSNMPQDNEYIGGSPSSWANVQITFDSTEVITFCFTCSAASLSGLGYYAECIGYNVDGNPIEVEGCSYKEQEIEVKNTYSSVDVAAAIEGLLIAPEPIELTGNCDHALKGDLGTSVIKHWGNIISTKSILSAANMFNNNKAESIPFDINCVFDQTGNFNSMFSSTGLKTLPKVIKACPSNAQGLFYNSNPNGFF